MKRRGIRGLCLLGMVSLVWVVLLMHPPRAALAIPGGTPHGGAMARRLPSPATPHTIVEVAIPGFFFDPPVVTVAPGTTVRWTQMDTTPHTTTSAAGSPLQWDSGSMPKNTTFDVTFTTPGVYNYVCTPHPGMDGQIIVQAYPPQAYIPLIVR